MSSLLGANGKTQEGSRVNVSAYVLAGRTALSYQLCQRQPNLEAVADL